jgi:peptidoglycan/LPS O-acetylase OafA/YrhL
MTAEHQPAYRPDIDGLRAVAVLAVVAYHVAPARITGGFVGVDVFFVISGFLISSIIIGGLTNETFSYRTFYIRRIRRIFPALALVCLFTLVAGWLLLLPDEYEQLGKHVVAGSLFVSNLQLWSEAGYFDAASGLKPLLHLWSLGIEEQFYIVWPLVLALMWRKRDAAPRWILAVLLASFALCVAIGLRDPTAAFYLPMARFWQLLVGALLAALAAQGRGIFAAPNKEEVSAGWMRQTLALVGFSLIVVSILGIDSQTSYPTLRAGLPTIATAMVIVAGPFAYVNRYLLANGAAVFIGLVSYPLYLWHWPLLSFLEIVEPPGSMRLYKVAAAMLAFGLAVATYLLLEKRVRTPPYVRVSKLILASAFCLAAGAAVVARSGFVAERGPWGIQTTPVRFEPGQMITSQCLDQYGQLFRPRPISTRDFCTAADSTRDVVRVLGDSHASRLFLGLRNVDPAHHYQNLGRGTCIPFLGFDGQWPDTGEALICRETTQNLVEDSARFGGAVVIHGFFVRAYNGGLKLTSSDGLREHARATFSKLAETRTQTILVLDVPELPFEPTACIARPALRGLVRTTCSFPVQDWQRYISATNKTLTDAAAEYGVAVFDPTSVLCDAAECHAVRNGELLYTDSHHLSLTGAALVADPIRKLLDAPPPSPESSKRATLRVSEGVQ